MTFTIRLQENAIEGNNSITQTQSYTCATVVHMEETCTTGTTDQEHLLALDISQMKVFYMVSDVALTVETNSGSVPQETFTLAANKPVTWREGDSAIFAGDVTGLYLTNASGSTATLKVMAGLDI